MLPRSSLFVRELCSVPGFLFGRRPSVIVDLLDGLDRMVVSKGYDTSVVSFHAHPLYPSVGSNLVFL